MSAARIRVCFVCLGNICRSPTAEGVMKKLVAHAGLSHAIEVKSAGTGSWHIGELADPRTRAEASRRGVELTSRARHFTHKLFADADYVVAMDRKNQSDLLQLAKTAEERAKVTLLRSFDGRTQDDLDVPDPYYGGARGFADVYEICEAGCVALLAHLRERHGL